MRQSHNQPSSPSALLLPPHPYEILLILDRPHHFFFCGGSASLSGCHKITNWIPHLFFIIRIAHQLAVLDILRLSVTGTSWNNNKNPVGLLITHLSKSLSLEESRKPLANGLLSIFSFVIYQFNKNKNKKWAHEMLLFYLISIIFCQFRSYSLWSLRERE